MSLGSVFGIFAGFYYWLGKMSGRQYPEALGKLPFWLTFIGVNIAFFPLHFLGLAGMPRRIPDSPEAFSWWHLVPPTGSYISFAGFLLFLALVWPPLPAGQPCSA